MIKINKLVSIVIPVYNMGDKIEKCIESICKQTYENIEIIIIDDGSNDNSLSVCKEIEKIDSRVKVYHIENSGPGPARNNGIKHANGDYIYFPDADDLIEKNAIEKLVTTAEKDGSDLIVFGYKKIYEDHENVKQYDSIIFSGEDIRRDYYNYSGMNKIYGIQGAPWNKFFNLQVIKKYDIEFPDLRRHEDEVFIARYVNYVKQVSFIPDILYTYYVNDIYKEWNKYPLNYIDYVNKLYEEQKKNMLIWNKEDYRTHDFVKKAYLVNFCKALELSFSPKFNFSYKKRINWIRSNLSSNKIDKIATCNDLKLYYKTAYFFIRHKYIHCLYFLLWLCQKNRQYKNKKV